jgi:hypothetical protein
MLEHDPGVELRFYNSGVGTYTGLVFTAVIRQKFPQIMDYCMLHNNDVSVMQPLTISRCQSKRWVKVG